MATTRSKIFEAVAEALLNAQAAAYIPSTPYTGSLPKGTVKKGDKGSDVKNLQSFLNWCIKAGLAVDGSCGKKTVSAIKKFQKQYGLTVDGIFGSKSRKKAQAIIKAHKPKPKPTPTHAPTSSKEQKIAEKAREFAWAYGTPSSTCVYSKNKKKCGSAKTAYKTALKKYMKKKAKISQTDCGYFASTCVRGAGVSSSFLALPAKASQVYPGLPKELSIVHKGTVGTFALKEGDVIRYRKSNGHQHVVVYVGDGKIAHAGRGNWFPKIDGSKPWNNSNVKQSTIQVIRAK